MFHSNRVRSMPARGAGMLGMVFGAGLAALA
jgi:hypothetical protein